MIGNLVATTIRLLSRCVLMRWCGASVTDDGGDRATAVILAPRRNMRMAFSHREGHPGLCNLVTPLGLRPLLIDPSPVLGRPPPGVTELLLDDPPFGFEFCQHVIQVPGTYPVMHDLVQLRARKVPSFG